MIGRQCLRHDHRQRLRQQSEFCRRFGCNLVIGIDRLRPVRTQRHGDSAQALQHVGPSQTKLEMGDGGDELLEPARIDEIKVELTVIHGGILRHDQPAPMNRVSDVLIRSTRSLTAGADRAVGVANKKPSPNGRLRLARVKLTSVMAHWSAGDQIAYVRPYRTISSGSNFVRNTR